MTTFAQRTKAAPVDALLIAQAVWAGDTATRDYVLSNADPWETTRQLAAWLRTAIQKALALGAGGEFGDVHEFDVIARWLHDVQQEATP